MNKVLESKAIIRFQDCDPFNHLNNAAYINYFINAREDQLKAQYNIDIYEMAKQKGISWVVGSNQIAYLKPALLMEEVIINTQLIRLEPSKLYVELRMWNIDKTEIKAVMWSTFVHYNLQQKKREMHSDKLTDLFKSVLNPIDETVFEDRILILKNQKV